jgi:hypothetical protein
VQPLGGAECQPGGELERGRQVIDVAELPARRAAPHHEQPRRLEMPGQQRVADVADQCSRALPLLAGLAELGFWTVHGHPVSVSGQVQAFVSSFALIIVGLFAIHGVQGTVVRLDPHRDHLAGRECPAARLDTLGVDSIYVGTDGSTAAEVKAAAPRGPVVSRPPGRAAPGQARQVAPPALTRPP